MSDRHDVAWDYEPDVVGMHITQRKPEWLRPKVEHGADVLATKKTLRDLHLVTVCEEAGCPNLSECWKEGTATFMVLGERCTRACGFCAVSTAKPFALEADEPQRVAEATRRMGLKHVVITAVARDDLADGGAEHFRQTIEATRAANPGIVIEVLVPDFLDQDESIATVLAAIQIFGRSSRKATAGGRKSNFKLPASIT